VAEVVKARVPLRAWTPRPGEEIVRNIVGETALVATQVAPLTVVWVRNALAVTKVDAPGVSV